MRPLLYLLTVPYVHCLLWDTRNLFFDRHLPSSMDNMWHNFKRTVGKNYIAPTLEQTRKLIFERNMQFIKDFNENSAVHRGFELAWNSFADMTPDEFRRSYRGFGGTEKTKINPPVASTPYIPSIRELPKSVNWVQEGLVSPVLYQGVCSSCWAISAAGTLEGQAAKLLRRHETLSIQEFVDCSSSNNGCNGGYPDVALLDLKRIGGIDSRSAYAYTGRKGKCKYPNVSNEFEVEDVILVAPDEKLLQKAVAEIGPISVAIDTNPKALQFYRRGVFFSPECRPHNINHAVLLVGYGTENGRDYWLIKNSWGSDWGEGGYLKLARNRNNHCGITNYATFPKLRRVR